MLENLSKYHPGAKEYEISGFIFWQGDKDRYDANNAETYQNTGAVLGRAMAKLPVEPRVARMLLAARETGCLEAVTIIAAGMAIPDPRLRPPGEEGEADAAHRSLRGNEESDFLALLSLWQHYVTHLRESGSSATRRWCIANHLSWVRMLEWRDIHGQLRRALREPGLLRHAEQTPQASSIHRALLHGCVFQFLEFR